MEAIVVGGIFLAVTLLTFALLSMFFADDRRVSRRLKGLTEYEAGQAREWQPLLKSFQQRMLRRTRSTISSAMGSVRPSQQVDKVRHRLDVAGMSDSMTPEGFLAVKLGLALGLVALTVLAVTVSRLPAGWRLLLVILGGVLGYLLPNVWLNGVTDTRKSRIRRDLPDMLDMLTISVEAGLGFDAALAKYVKNSTGALAVEFARVLQEVQAGVPRRDSLKRLSERTEVAELSSFISAMVQADILGTSVSQVLRTQSSEMRLRRRQKAEEEAQKLPVKLVFPVVLCILPATIIAIMGPAVIRLIGLFGG